METDNELIRMERERAESTFYLTVVRTLVGGAVVLVLTMASCEVAVKFADPCAGAARTRPNWCPAPVVR